MRIRLALISLGMLLITSCSSAVNASTETQNSSHQQTLNKPNEELEIIKTQRPITIAEAIEPIDRPTFSTIGDLNIFDGQDFVVTDIEIDFKAINEGVPYAPAFKVTLESTNTNHFPSSLGMMIECINPKLAKSDFRMTGLVPVNTTEFHVVRLGTTFDESAKPISNCEDYELMIIPIRNRAAGDYGFDSYRIPFSVKDFLPKNIF